MYFPNMKYSYVEQPFHGPDYVPDFTPQAVGYEPEGYMPSQSTLLTFNAPGAPVDYYGFSIGGWSPGKYVGKVADTVKSTTGWSPGKYVGKVADTGWHPGKYAGSALSGLKGMLDAPGQIMGEMDKTMQFMLYMPIIVGGVIVMGILAIIAVMILKKKSAKED